jgi:four helix bundle protein
MAARTVRELVVWQLCEELRLAVVAATAAGGVARNVQFCDQIREAAVDAVADVAEGFARFRPKEFALFLGYAISSLAEVETRARDGHSRRYFDDETTSAILRLAARAESAARALRRYLWSAPITNRPEPRPSRRRRIR